MSRSIVEEHLCEREGARGGVKGGIERRSEGRSREEE
jgi:hypothetical protein